MMRTYFKHNQRGDTIVEVLIAIAVVSLVLAGAFGVSQKSSIATRDSQEHSEAQKLVESQLESLRAWAAAGTGTNVFTIGSDFCINSPTSVSTCPHSAH